MTESELIKIAQHHPSDDIANHAMRILRTFFDKSYMFCIDCDGLVVKRNECCLNQILSNNTKLIQRYEG